jgi:hypothetical protein
MAVMNSKKLGRSPGLALAPIRSATGWSSRT